MAVSPAALPATIAMLVPSQCRALTIEAASPATITPSGVKVGHFPPAAFGDQVRAIFHQPAARNQRGDHRMVQVALQQFVRADMVRRQQVQVDTHADRNALLAGVEKAQPGQPHRYVAHAPRPPGRGIVSVRPKRALIVSSGREINCLTTQRHRRRFQVVLDQSQLLGEQVVDAFADDRHRGVDLTLRPVGHARRSPCLRRG